LIKEDEMGRASNKHEEDKRAYKILVVKPDEKILLGRRRCR
jgi:hypothetical protein